MKRLNVGDAIRVTLGAHVRSGKVVEDRGDLGVGGEQIVRVRIGLQEMEFSRSLVSVRSRRSR